MYRFTSASRGLYACRLARSGNYLEAACAGFTYASRGLADGEFGASQTKRMLGGPVVYLWIDIAVDIRGAGVCPVCVCVHL